MSAAIKIKITCNEPGSLRGKQKYSSTLSLTYALYGVVNAAIRPLYCRGRVPVQEAEPVCTGAKNLAPSPHNEIRYADLPARSQSLPEIRTKIKVLPTTWTDDFE
jgi:hypothetical protein